MINITRFALRREAIRLRRSGDTERAILLQQICDDDEMLEVINEASVAEFEHSGYNKNSESDRPFGGKVQLYLQWIVEHREQILKFALVIVQLLAMGAPTKQRE